MASAVRNVLRGGFMTEDFDSWKVPSFNLRCYISSTFTDTHNERDVIARRLTQEFEDICRPHGIDICFVDMRFGVKNASTDDHMTWDLIKAELVRCRQESCGTFFISLQGNKYGYRPVPREIDQVLFDIHMNNYGFNDRDELIALAKKWYILDNNSIPPKYVLMKLDSSNWYEYWDVACNKLLKLLNGLMFEEGLFVGDSVTGWETYYTLNGNTNNDRAFWMKRDIVDVMTDVNDPKREFDDTRDNADIASRLAMLHSTLNTKLSGRIYTSTIDSVSSINYKNNAFTDYIEGFYNKLKSLLSSEIQLIIERKECWVSNAYDSGLQGDVYSDIAHHYSLARSKALDFDGRDEVVNAAMGLIQQSGHESGIQCCIVGKSGCGKTCFMARLASLLYKVDGIPVIIRFCGTNDSSASGLNLLRSIIGQVYYTHGITNRVIPEPYSELVACFQSLMSSYPVILLIDGLDQLSDHNLERRKVSFLKNIKVHRNGKIIVSCVLDDYNYREATGYVYGCDITLKKWKIPRVHITSFTNDMKLVLDSYIAKSGRCLLPSQRDVVLNSALQQQDPTALFIKLAARVACSWKSSDASCVIGSSVPSLINQIFDEMQFKYGSALIKAAIAFITLSYKGITSWEMEDLLSLDDDVMDEVNEYNMSKRLAAHVWSRVQYELSGLIVESDEGCIKWYYRTVLETAAMRYTKEEEVYYHQIMGKYFSNRVDNGIAEQKGIYRHKLLTKNDVKPVWYRSSSPYINRRRCAEGAYHLIEGCLYEEAIDEICDLERVCAYVVCGLGQLLLNNLSLVYSKVLQYVLEEGREKAYHYMRWLRKSSQALSANSGFDVVKTAFDEPYVSSVKLEVTELLRSIKYPSTIHDDDLWLCQWILGRSSSTFEPLWTTFTDSDFITSVCFSSDGSHIASGSHDKTVIIWEFTTGMSIETLIGHTNWVSSVCFSSDHTRVASGSYDTTIKIWLPITGECLNTLNGHSKAVSSVCFSLDGSRLASGSHDKSVKLWNAVTGECINHLEGHNNWVTSVCFSPDGYRLASGSYDKSVKLWDAVTGECVNTLNGHTNWVSSVCFSPDGLRIASGSQDKVVMIWNSITGECLSTLCGHSGPINTVCFICDGSRIASGSQDKVVMIWDSITGECISKLEGHDQDVSSVCFSPDGSLIVSSGWDKKINTWEVQWKSEEWNESHKSKLGSSVLSEDCMHGVSHDGSKVAVAYADVSNRIISLHIEVWDIFSGKLLKMLTIPLESKHGQGLDAPRGAPRFSWDDSRLLCVGWLYAVVLDCKDWSTLYHRDNISSTTSRDGFTLAVAFDGKVEVWDLVSVRLLKTLIIPQDGNPQSQYSGSSMEHKTLTLEFSPDGSQLLGYNDDGIEYHRCIHIWITSDWQCRSFFFEADYGGFSWLFHAVIVYRGIVLVHSWHDENNMGCGYNRCDVALYDKNRKIVVIDGSNYGTVYTNLYDFLKQVIETSEGAINIGCNSQVKKSGVGGGCRGTLTLIWSDSPDFSKDSPDLTIVDDCRSSRMQVKLKSGFIHVSERL